MRAALALALLAAGCAEPATVSVTIISAASDVVDIGVPASRCGDCYIEIVQCGIQQCSDACTPDPATDACVACQASAGCIDAFEVCCAVKCVETPCDDP